MFTQQAPYIMATMAGGNDVTNRQMVQAFANCNQSLTHRGPVSLQGGVTNNQAGVLQPPHGGTSNYYFAGDDFVGGNTQVGGGASFPIYQGGDYYGSPNVTYTPGNDATQQGSPWLISYQNYYGVDSPTTYNNYVTGSDLYLHYPQLSSNNYYDNSQQFEFGPVSSVYNSNWNTQLGDSNLFDFSTRQGDLVSNYAGPTFQVAGDSYFDNSIHNSTTAQNQYVTNQTVEESNVTNIRYSQSGDPATAGPAGPPGEAGSPGLAGPAGAPGAVLFVPGIILTPSLPQVRIDVGPPRPPAPPPAAAADPLHLHNADDSYLCRVHYRPPHRGDH